MRVPSAPKGSHRDDTRPACIDRRRVRGGLPRGLLRRRRQGRGRDRGATPRRRAGPRSSRRGDARLRFGDGDLDGGAGKAGGPDLRRCIFARWRHVDTPSWLTHPSKSLTAGARRIPRTLWPFSPLDRSNFVASSVGTAPLGPPGRVSGTEGTTLEPDHSGWLKASAARCVRTPTCRATFISEAFRYAYARPGAWITDRDGGGTLSASQSDTARCGGEGM